jgi:hypothetical protein
MNPFQLVIVVSMLATLGIGIAVLAVPVRRSTHFAFGWLTAFVLAWLGSMLTTTLARTPEAAALWIRMSSVAGALAPVGVALMRAAIIRSNEPLRRVAPSLWPWLVAYLTVAVT